MYLSVGCLVVSHVCVMFGCVTCLWGVWLCHMSVGCLVVSHVCGVFGCVTCLWGVWLCHMSVGCLVVSHNNTAQKICDLHAE
jgi:hypothetical protein